jgi:hypothetical protein
MLLDTTHVVSDLQLEYDSCLVAKDDSLLGADRQWVALLLACSCTNCIYVDDTKSRKLCFMSITNLPLDKVPVSK